MYQPAVAWLCLLGAAFCEMAWTYSLKYINVPALKTLQWATLFRSDGGLPVLLPWLGYFAFGIINSVLLAIAMRCIPTATAFAVWMAGSLIFMKLVDVFWQKMSWSFTEVFFGFLLIVGIVGLKLANPTP